MSLLSGILNVMIIRKDGGIIIGNRLKIIKKRKKEIFFFLIVLFITCMKLIWVVQESELVIVKAPRPSFLHRKSYSFL